MATVANRGDINFLPAPLKNQIVNLAGRPHSVLPGIVPVIFLPSRPLMFVSLDRYDLRPPDGQRQIDRFYRQCVLPWSKFNGAMLIHQLAEILNAKR
jgi:hypothetical protein